MSTNSKTVYVLIKEAVENLNCDSGNLSVESVKLNATLDAIEQEHKQLFDRIFVDY